MTIFNYIKFSICFILIFSVIFTFSINMSTNLGSKHIEPISNEIKPRTIIIDAGHGGEDGGACNYGGLYEKDLNLMISLQLYDMLKSFGFNAVLTRTNDELLYDKSLDYKGKKKSMDLAARLKIANSYENAILVSIHMNAFPQPKYKGLQVYYSNKGQELSNIVHDNYKKYISPTSYRKPKKAGSNIYLMDRFDGEGILIECGFLSNEEERALLNTKEYREKLAMCFFISIIDYITLSNK